LRRAMIIVMFLVALLATSLTVPGAAPEPVTPDPEDVPATFGPAPQDPRSDLTAGTDSLARAEDELAKDGLAEDELAEDGLAEDGLAEDELAGGLAAPTWVALRSLMVPGWGQAKNGMWWKALIVAGIEGAMIERLYFEDRRVHVYRQKKYDYPGQTEYYERKEQRHKGHRRDFIWWTSLFVILSMGDAFVDAHLKSFDVHLEGSPAPADVTDGEANSLSLRLAVAWGW